MSQENINVARVRRILERLKQCQARQLSCYGSKSHGFRLKSPLSEANLQAFETEHKASLLPQSWRMIVGTNSSLIVRMNHPRPSGALKSVDARMYQQRNSMACITCKIVAIGTTTELCPISQLKTSNLQPGEQ